ncbi:MAG: alanine--glyoxylate aminotransferase family protein [Thermoguttaceae bacterium]|nr:alanine--glyoxylate aminotransferase family protein [Thermoguttaceae bacterium]
MANYRLMTPGPVSVPQEARLAMAQEQRNHRTAEFRAVLAELHTGLAEILATRNQICLLTSSGTGGMEAAVANLVAAGENGQTGSKVIVLESGKFAERWSLMAERFGAEVVRYTVPWGDSFDPAELERLLAVHPDTVAVFATLSESSTGVGHRIPEFGEIVARTPAVFVVDAISGAGCMDCETDAWRIDLLVVGSQKALMGPPGAAMVAVSEKGWRRIESLPRRPVFYFDLLAYRKTWTKSDTPYTPATATFLALNESVKLIRREGVSRFRHRAQRLARATRAGVVALGMRLVAERPADGLTAAYLPDGVDVAVFLKRLETGYGVKLAGGQGPLTGKICRVAHMGNVDTVDILGTLAAIEMVLREMGAAIVPGSGVAAAQESLLNEFEAE